jgi:predicted alpha/beta hydrolase
LLTVPATDGFPLAATWHGADQPARFALLAPATGVRRRLYDDYAGDLARRGFGALTWDWRGTGDSRPGDGLVFAGGLDGRVAAFRL